MVSLRDAFGAGILTKLIEPIFDEVAPALSSGPVADIGCADGDLGLLCAYLGGQVDAIDHIESSFNQMRGIDVLREALGLPLDVHDIDLDGRFHLPRSDYRFVFFLGTLYHLKNPYYVLENLASHADWCVLSTRIAQVTAHQTPLRRIPSLICSIPGRPTTIRPITGYSPRLDCSGFYPGRDGRCLVTSGSDHD